MDKATIRGCELEYEVTGSAEPVLLIGTGPIADSFRPFDSQPALAGFSLARYHQRRLAEGAQDAQPVSFAEHAADAAGLLAHLGWRRAHVVGHSTGAAIALQLALDHEDRVATLTLLEPPLLAVPGAGAFFERAGAALAAYGAGHREEAVARFLSVVSSLDWDRCRVVIETHVPGGVARAVEDADNFFGSYLPALSAWQFDARHAAAIRQPVMSVVGTQTEPLFKEGHRLLRSWFPQLEECVVEDVAHLLHLQRPQAVATCVAAFLRRHAMTGG